MSDGKSYTWAEIAKHNTATDCWIVIDGRVYNMTGFLTEHPGGKNVVVKLGGKDATKEFNMFHKPLEVLRKYGPRLYIGKVAGGAGGAGAGGAATGSAAAGGGDKKVVVPVSKAEHHAGAPFKVASTHQGATATAADQGFKVGKLTASMFGEQIPYGDPSWYSAWNSPYYNESHRTFRAAVRQFVDTEMMPFAHEWDEAKAFPKSFFKKAYEFGILGATVGAPWQTKYAGTKLAGGLKPEQFDSFHDLILIDEMARTGSGGLLWGVFGGISIGLPPVIQFGSKELADRIAPKCLHGEAVICLAITEPDAGSDVANLKTTAVKTEDGQHYIVNGSKKWITNGVFADYFTVAVRTGGKGMSGISLLLIEKTMPGVTTRQMNCSGVWASGTTYITFEDVKVPVSNLIGVENQGFLYVMYNFNHERWATAVQAIRFSRVCLEEALKYSLKRETFGKKLIEHPVIRLKMAHMARQIEASQAWLESITYQMNTMNHKEQQSRLGGAIALLKAQASTVFEYCAREAAQIFGGLSYTRGGQGEKVERLYREVRAYAIPAGSEEIMLDLGVREALKKRKPVPKSKL